MALTEFDRMNLGYGSAFKPIAPNSANNLVTGAGSNPQTSTAQGITIPRNPTPINGSSYTAIGASVGGGPGAAVGFLVDAGLSYFQQDQAKKANRKQVQEAKRIERLNMKLDAMNRAEQRRLNDIQQGFTERGMILSEQGFDETLRRNEFEEGRIMEQDRIAELDRTRNALLGSVELKQVLAGLLASRGRVGV